MNFNIFNIQTQKKTQKKTQNIHNNNNKEKDATSGERVTQDLCKFLFQNSLCERAHTILPYRLQGGKKSLPKKLQYQNTIKLSKAANFPKCR